MENENENIKEKWISILLGVFAILIIKSIFENDNSKIVSKKGRQLLSDDEKMKEINKKISFPEGENQHQEIFI